MSYSPQQNIVDYHLAPVEITTGSNTIDIEETVSGTTQTFTITIPAGTYFCFHRKGPNHDSPAVNLTPTWKTGFDGLYRDIVNRLNSNTNGATTDGGYQIEWVPPSAGAFPYASTVRLFHTDTNVDSFRITNPIGDFPMKFLGHNPDDPDVGISLDSSGDGSGHQELVGRHTVDGVWTSPHFAAFKRSFQEREVEHARVDFERSVVAEWDSYIPRPFEYQRVPAIHAVKFRARKPEYPDIGELDWWDKYNAFERHWERVNGAEKFLIFHGTPWAGADRPDGTTVDWNNATPDIELADANVTASSGRTARSTVEIAKMFNDDQITSMRETAGMDREKSSEHYPIEFDLVCDPDQHVDY